MSNVKAEYHQDQTIRNVRQAIIVVKGSEPHHLARTLVKGTMELMSQYDNKNSGYVGNYEHGKWKFVAKAWDEQGTPQDIYEVEDAEIFEEIIMMASLETVPMNSCDEGSPALILGPYDEKRLAFLTQNCTKL